MGGGHKRGGHKLELELGVEGGSEEGRSSGSVIKKSEW